MATQTTRETEVSVGVGTAIFGLAAIISAIMRLPVTVSKAFSLWILYSVYAPSVNESLPHVPFIAAFGIALVIPMLINQIDPLTVDKKATWSQMFTSIGYGVVTPLVVMLMGLVAYWLVV